MLALLELTILAILFSRRPRMSLYRERKKWLKKNSFRRGKSSRDADPPPQSQPCLTPNNIGICRIAFSRRYRPDLRGSAGKEGAIFWRTQEDQGTRRCHEAKTL